MIQRPDTLRSLLAILAAVILVILTSCTVQRVERMHTREANEALETYYHRAVWDRQNSTRGEIRTAKRELRSWLREQKQLTK